MNYIHFYNKLIKLTTNKTLYKSLGKQDSFNDRLLVFLFHFAFFLKVFKSEENEKKLQEIYDFNFRQLELSIREIGYGDQTINKKMKDYINLFHSMINEIHYWDTLNINEKNEKFLIFLKDFSEISNLIAYFDDFNKKLSKKNLNYFLNCVSTT